MVEIFFYGSGIDLKILKEKGFSPEHYEVARLYGFDIKIQPIANLIRRDSHMIYGVLLSMTREKHQKILIALTQGVMGTNYLPEAVLVETLDGKWKPAICYIAAHSESKPADPSYLNLFIESAKKWKFPECYIKHLESFR